MLKDTLKDVLKLESAIRTLLGNNKTTNRIMVESKRIPDNDVRKTWLEQLVRLIVCKDDTFIKMLEFVRIPVGPEEFLLSPTYLGKKGEVYPEVLAEYVDLCTPGKYDEAVLTGGIGAAKTTLGLYAQAYQLYYISCLRNPQRTYGLDPSTEIKIIFQSLRESTARGVDYSRFRAMIEKSPYFNQVFPYEKGTKAVLKFPHRIMVTPLTGSETAAIGENVIGGIIDEINFMNKVQNSKQSADGGTYDQAVELYNSIARRRKSRFMSGGRMAGLLCVVSSKRLPGEFTDRKMQEAKHNPRIFVYDKRVWDIKPNAFKSGMFRIHIGDETKRPRILNDYDVIPKEEEHLIDHIPVEFKQEFVDDITKAVRDIAGHTTLATTPFLSNSEKVIAAFTDRPQIATVPRVDFINVKCQVSAKLCKRNPQFHRFAHIDLGLTGDSAGVAIGHVPQFIHVEETGMYMPLIKYDMILEVAPPLGGEIEFAKIRKLLLTLRDLGLPIKWVTLDSYQSIDTLQILRSHGFVTGLQSMDTSLVPYDTLKTAIYDGRVDFPMDIKARTELLALEINHLKRKVDHNEQNTKDVSDSLAGVAFGLTQRREIWAQHKVPINMMIVQDKDTLRAQTNKTQSFDPDVVLSTLRR